MAGIRSRTAIRVVAWTGVAALGGAGLYGVASAAMTPSAGSGTATVTTQNVATDPSGAAPDVTGATERARSGHAGHPRLRRFLAGRVLHGEFVVAAKDGATKTIAVQKGEVTSVGSDTVTVKSRDGYTLTWRVNDATRIRKAGKNAELSDLAAGDRVAAIGEKTSAGVTARAMIARRAKGDAENNDKNDKGDKGSGEPSSTGDMAVIQEAALTI
jgi:hypothetical protein